MRSKTCARDVLCKNSTATHHVYFSFSDALSYVALFKLKHVLVPHLDHQNVGDFGCNFMASVRLERLTCRGIHILSCWLTNKVIPSGFFSRWTKNDFWCLRLWSEHYHSIFFDTVRCNGINASHIPWMVLNCAPPVFPTSRTTKPRRYPWMYLYI